MADRVAEGWLAVANGSIAEYGEGRYAGASSDVEGDFILPGLVELHTDHLEAHAMPRPKVTWDPRAAVLAYDAQIVASGITTVFDSLRAGELSDSDSVSRVLHELADAIGDLCEFGLLRAEHLTHLRCEIATPNVVQEVHTYATRRPIQLISLMDHTPGQRQFRDLEKMRIYYQRHGLSDDADFAAFVEERLVMHERYAHANRRALVELAHRQGVALASHDDATIGQVEEAIADRVSIAEFPTTIDAARASRQAQIKVMMGAPNLVRGGSHSGNIAAEDLARDGTLEILSSDYVPGSLLMAAFGLPRRVAHISLPQAVAMVSRNPARASGLTDRGEIACSQRADLVRVAVHGTTPCVRQVWRAGRLVF
jgi:alpha-D-ribose 1-methylphosphonate 5-triphosphate diphosphatase